MGTRAQFAADLSAKLPKSMPVLDHPKDPGQLSARLKGQIILVRTSVAPAGNQGNFDEAFEVWLLQPKSDDLGAAETALDDSLDLLIAALLDMPHLTWSTAVRSTFKDTYPAFKIELTLKSKQ